jgi:hypothetical protein
MNNISTNLTSLGQSRAAENTNFETIQNPEYIAPQLSDTDMEENDDPLNKYRQATNETCLQSVLPDYPITLQGNNERCSLGNEVYNIAPGERKHPVSIMMDKKCEELAFLVLFPKGRFGYTEEREIKLTPVKYFNARLLHYSGRFATNPEYLFFAQFVIE